MGSLIKQTIGELQRVCLAKELLDMELGDRRQLDNLEDQHSNLLGVWKAIAEIWVKVDEIDRTPFSVYMHKTVKDLIDAKQNEMREFPNRMRTVAIYETYENQLKNYKKVNDTLSDMRADSMKRKHWNEVLSKLKLTAVKFNDLTLGHLWCADILSSKKAIDDVLT